MTDDWVPVPDAPEMIDEMLLQDFDMIDEMTHPMRSRILNRLRQPRSVAEVAAELDVPVTRLYHHVKRLEELGLITVVATRRAAVVTERQYRNVAREFRVDREVIAAADPDTLGRAVGSAFDVARTEFQREVSNGALAAGDLEGRAAINFSEFTLSDEQLTDFLARMRQLFEEFAALDASDGIRFRLLVAGFPLSD